jgi:hypothetical protein
VTSVTAAGTAGHFPRKPAKPASFLRLKLEARARIELVYTDLQLYRHHPLSRLILSHHVFCAFSPAAAPDHRVFSRRFLCRPVAISMATIDCGPLEWKTINCRR